MSIFSEWLKKPLGSSKSIGNQIVNVAYRAPAVAVASLYSPRAAQSVSGNSGLVNHQGATNLTYASRIAAALFGGAYALGAFTPAAAPVSSGAGMLSSSAQSTMLGIGDLSWTAPAAIDTSMAPLPGLGVNSLLAAPAPTVASIPSIAPTIAAANESGGSSLLAKATGWAGLWKTLTGGSGGALDLPAQNPVDAAGGTNIGITTPGQAGDLTQVPLGDLAGMNPITAGTGGSTAGAFIIPGMIIAALVFFLWKSPKK